MINDTPQNIQKPDSRKIKAGAKPTAGMEVKRGEDRCKNNSSKRSGNQSFTCS